MAFHRDLRRRGERRETRTVRKLKRNVFPSFREGMRAGGGVHEYVCNSISPPCGLDKNVVPQDANIRAQKHAKTIVNRMVACEQTRGVLYVVSSCDT